MRGTFVLVATLVAGVVCGSAHAQAAKPIAFSVSTVKHSPSTAMRIGFNYTDSGLSIENVPLESVIRAAYQLQDGQLVNLPEWARHENFDIEAKVDDEDRQALKTMGRPERQAMLQALLAERFQLKTHPETREVPAFNLVVAKGGAKLTPAAKEDARTRGDAIGFRHGELKIDDCSMETFAKTLAQLTHHLVADRTGLTGRYDLMLRYSDETTPPSAEAAAPSIYTALQEQMGLKLDWTKAAMPVVVVDRIERPTAD